MKPLHCSYDISQDVDQSLQHSGVNAEIFRGKTVFVTGGTGFFGVWLLSMLVSVKQQLGGDLRLMVLSRAPDKFIQTHPLPAFSSQLEFVRGDVKSFRLDASTRITHLIHMATTNAGETFAGEDQLNKLDMLYMGTRNVLEQCGSSLEKVLFTSSGVAYGVNNNPFITEVDHTGPDTTETGAALGIGKLAAEYLIAYHAAKYGYSYAIARCFSFAGQFLPLDLHYAFGNFIHNAMHGENIIIHSDGQDLRSYLYIGDAMAWMCRLLSEPDNQIYNIGSEHAITIEGLARKIAQRAKQSVEVLIQGKPSEVGNFRRASYVPSIKKITKNHPGLQEWTSLDEMIDKMLITSLIH